MAPIMSDTLEGLRRQLTAATELKAVVRAMKALAASSLGQFERAVSSLADYDQTVRLALKAGLASEEARRLLRLPPIAQRKLRVVIFGSDQGLVGQFNEVMAETMELQIPPFRQPMIWAVGSRLGDSLRERGFRNITLFELPQAVDAIAGLIGALLQSLLDATPQVSDMDLRLFHHRPLSGARYVPVAQQLFPLGRAWKQSIAALAWPTNHRPEQIGGESFDAILREYLFVSLFRACAESLASENSSRLMAMQRAEKNINELSGTLTHRFHQLRQSSIDEELFDVVSGFEAFSRSSKPPTKVDP